MHCSSEHGVKWGTAVVKIHRLLGWPEGKELQKLGQEARNELLRCGSVTVWEITFQGDCLQNPLYFSFGSAVTQKVPRGSPVAGVR